MRELRLVAPVSCKEFEALDDVMYFLHALLSGSSYRNDSRSMTLTEEVSSYESYRRD